MKGKTTNAMHLTRRGSIRLVATMMLLATTNSLVFSGVIWQQVTIPNLPANTTLSSVWDRRPNEVYVWGNSTTNSIPNAALYHWDGTSWTKAIDAPGESPASVFGVGTAEVFAATTTSMWRSIDNGLTWTRVVLPGGNPQLGRIRGTPNNIQVLTSSGGSSSIMRFNGTAWTTVSTDSPQALHILSPDEGYFVTCWGWGKWDGTSWNYFSQGFDFCDIYDTWAIRDGVGALHWWAVGNNNFANGVRIWCFDTTAVSFGGKNAFCFSDGSGYNIGSATGIWGANANDVYVIGGLASTSGGSRSGRVYHFDGTAWAQLSVGDIYPTGIWGSASDDVWICGGDGKLMHLAQAAELQISMYAGLNISGTVGATYEIQCRTNLVSDDWRSLTTIVLPSSPYFYLDMTSSSSGQRYYKAVLKP